MTQEEIDLRAQIAATLDRHTFPGDREALLATAEEHFAADRVLAWLRRDPSAGATGYAGAGLPRGPAALGSTLRIDRDVQAGSGGLPS